MQSTIEVFRHLIASLPPLIPGELKTRLVESLAQVESEEGVTVEEVEDVMILFGYEVWPYLQAYREFLNSYEAKVGEHFLLPKLSESLQSRYHEFKLYGGNLRDLHSGRPADFFTHEERGELCVAFVELQHELRRYVDQQIITTERDRFLARVEEFAALLEDIRDRLEGLKDLAHGEADHPNLANEIRARVRGFEYGLCYLGPELDYAAVCETPEFFRGRKSELNRLRGIHEPLNVDFYADFI